MSKKKIKIEFTPGSLEGFNGTPEQLQELIGAITQMFESEEFMKQVMQVDVNALSDNEIDELAEVHEDEFAEAHRILQ